MVPGSGVSMIVETLANAMALVPSRSVINTKAVLFKAVSSDCSILMHTKRLAYS